MDQLSLDKGLLLNRKFMKKIIKNPVEQDIYKASYRYPSKVVEISKPLSLNYYLHYFRKRIENKTESCKEWDITLVGSNLFIGQLKGVSKFGNKRDIKVGTETRPRDKMFLTVFWIDVFLTLITSIYCLLSIVLSYRHFIYFFHIEAAYFVIWFTVTSGISSIGFLVYKIIWNKNRFFFRKRKTWKVVCSIILFDIFSLSIGGIIHIFSEYSFDIGEWYYEMLLYLIPIVYFISLPAIIFLLLRSYHKGEPDLIARNLSTVWIRYQFLVIPDDEKDFLDLSMNSMLECKPKKLLIQVLISWDFKTISQAFADVEQAKSELAKLIKEVEIVFGGNIAM